MCDATGPVLKVTEIGGDGIRDPHEAINIVFREKYAAPPARFIGTVVAPGFSACGGR